MPCNALTSRAVGPRSANHAATDSSGELADSYSQRSAEEISLRCEAELCGHPQIYERLRTLARSLVARERKGQSLRPTDLVHDVYLRMARDQCRGDSTGHFLALAARMMRQILIDRARQRLALKRGGAVDRMWLNLDLVPPPQADARFERLYSALQALREMAPERARVVELRFFAGMTVEDVAEELGISVSTANRYWAFARAWLLREISS